MTTKKLTCPHEVLAFTPDGKSRRGELWEITVAPPVSELDHDTVEWTFAIEVADSFRADHDATKQDNKPLQRLLRSPTHLTDKALEYLRDLFARNTLLPLGKSRCRTRAERDACSATLVRARDTLNHGKFTSAKRGGLADVLDNFHFSRSTGQQAIPAYTISDAEQALYEAEALQDALFQLAKEWGRSSRKVEFVGQRLGPNDELEVHFPSRDEDGEPCPSAGFGPAPKFNIDNRSDRIDAAATITHVTSADTLHDHLNYRLGSTRGRDREWAKPNARIRKLADS